MYFHWQKQKAKQGRCGEMGGFTRLCATKGGQPDGLEREIPSLFTTQLPDEVLAKHFHFGVLNRPHSIKTLLETPRMLEQITSKFVLILETDHVLMKPIPNLATETTPAAFDGFAVRFASVSRIRSETAAVSHTQMSNTRG